ncbi:hypothetical protein LP7551_05069 [Roseibium album]|nr:hypothetical protein LP7551_05069 [Roseibium album]
MSESARSIAGEITRSRSSFRGGRIFDALSALDGPKLCERSAKLIAGDLRDGRYLVSMPKDAFYPGPARQFSSVCKALDAPETALEDLLPYLPSAVSVHFGYEPEAVGERFKCYIEFPPDAQPEPGLVFHSVKWVVGRVSSSATSRYWSRNRLSPGEQEKLVETLLPIGRAQEAALGILEVSARTARNKSATLLEVLEPGNPRHSIDINVAESGQRLVDFHNLLEPVFAEAGIGQMTDAFFKREGETRIGHFAAGTARDGSPFVTLYFDAGSV